jgi:hypothetical protein
MRKYIHKITSILMAVLVLFSTFSFTVAKHYCGDFLVAISYVGAVGTCEMNKDSSTTIKKSNCCTDEIDHIEGQDKLQKETSAHLSFDQQKTILSFVHSYHFLFDEIKLQKEFNKQPLPPDLSQDLQALYQIFLI